MVDNVCILQLFMGPFVIIRLNNHESLSRVNYL